MMVGGGAFTNTGPAELSMEREFIEGGKGRIAFTRWPGPTGAGTVVCVHGLTRNGRDFDRLAAALRARYTVLCPDMAGRGASDWLADAGLYGYPRYLADTAALLAARRLTEVDWIGTSMGGLIGLMMAAMPGTPIRRLVLNDIGPFLPASALRRIADYVGRDPVFDSVEELEAYLRTAHAPFGPLADEDWRHMARYGHRRDADGRLRLHYDPAIGSAFQAAIQGDIDQWAVWDRIACPVLVLRGAESDLLTAETAAAMAERGPKASVVEFPGIGHAPMLMSADQIACISEWLATR
jgi:pimeloyl-ACP methyl ester carboxylesterase